MTVKDEINATDKIKAFAFPMLLGVVSFFLIRLNSSIDKVTDSLIEVRINQKVVLYRLDELSKDTSDLRTEVEVIKKKLQIN